jgi:hypothetical protein
MSQSQSSSQASRKSQALPGANPPAPVVKAGATPEASPAPVSVVLPIAGADSDTRKGMRLSLSRALRLPRLSRRGKWIRNNAKGVYLYAQAGAPAQAGTDTVPPAPAIPPALIVGRSPVEADTDTRAPEAYKGVALDGVGVGFKLDAGAIAGAYGSGVTLDAYRAIVSDVLGALGFKLLSATGTDSASPDQARRKAARGMVGMLDGILCGTYGPKALPIVVDIAEAYYTTCAGTVAPEVSAKFGAVSKSVKAGAPARALVDAIGVALKLSAPAQASPAPAPEAGQAGASAPAQAGATVKA